METLLRQAVCHCSKYVIHLGLCQVNKAAGLGRVAERYCEAKLPFRHFLDNGHTLMCLTRRARNLVNQFMYFFISNFLVVQAVPVE